MKFLKCVYLSTLILALAVSVNAQSKDLTILSGVVTDTFGAVITNVLVTAQNKNGKKYGAKNGDDGEYKIPLPKGVYKLEFTRPPFKAVTIKEYRITNKSRRRLNISLICVNCELIEDISWLEQSL